jgi:hypothetical protein
MLLIQFVCWLYIFLFKLLKIEIEQQSNMIVWNKSDDLWLHFCCWFVFLLLVRSNVNSVCGLLFSSSPSSPSTETAKSMTIVALALLDDDCCVVAVALLLLLLSLLLLLLELLSVFSINSIVSSSSPSSSSKSSSCFLQFFFFFFFFFCFVLFCFVFVVKRNTIIRIVFVLYLLLFGNFLDFRRLFELFLQAKQTKTLIIIISKTFLLLSFFLKKKKTFLLFGTVSFDCRFFGDCLFVFQNDKINITNKDQQTVSLYNTIPLTTYQHCHRHRLPLLRYC